MQKTWQSHIIYHALPNERNIFETMGIGILFMNIKQKRILYFSSVCMGYAFVYRKTVSRLQQRLRGKGKKPPSSGKLSSLKLLILSPLHLLC